jgi:indolepyruvate ferredoxin oxidoreductase beta subunit
LADLEKLALDNGSVISAALFGALAGSGALPFPRAAFEDAIRSGGKGVNESLRAFAAAYEIAQIGAEPSAAQPDVHEATLTVTGPLRLRAKWESLDAKVLALPIEIRTMARAGLKAVVDYQSVDYGREYLERLGKIQSYDNVDKDWELTRVAAKYIARAMCYDDVIRVADLKTRGSRFERVRREMRPGDKAVIRMTEFMHPRAEEIVGMLPAGIGAYWEANPKRMTLVNRLLSKGRRVRSDSLFGFFTLYLLGGMRRWRLKTLRHSQEQANLNAWLACVADCSVQNYALGVEVLRCRRLIKGYSDTHKRGTSKYDRVIGALDGLKGREDAADWLRRLREAALQDEKGEALDGALRTISSFTEP